MGGGKDSKGGNTSEVDVNDGHSPVVYSSMDIFNDDDPTIRYDDDDNRDVSMEGFYTRKQWKVNSIMKKDAAVVEFDYPRNITGYYRGSWSRQPITSDTSDGDGDGKRGENGAETESEKGSVNQKNYENKNKNKKKDEGGKKDEEMHDRIIKKNGMRILST